MAGTVAPYPMVILDVFKTDHEANDLLLEVISMGGGVRVVLEQQGGISFERSTVNKIKVYKMLVRGDAKLEDKTVMQVMKLVIHHRKAAKAKAANDTAGGTGAPAGPRTSPVATVTATDRADGPIVTPDTATMGESEGTSSATAHKEWFGRMNDPCEATPGYVRRYVQETVTGILTLLRDSLALRHDLAAHLARVLPLISAEMGKRCVVQLLPTAVHPVVPAVLVPLANPPANPPVNNILAGMEARAEQHMFQDTMRRYLATCNGPSPFSKTMKRQRLQMLMSLCHDYTLRFLNTQLLRAADNTPMPNANDQAVVVSVSERVWTQARSAVRANQHI